MSFRTSRREWWCLRAQEGNNSPILNHTKTEILLQNQKALKRHIASKLGGRGIHNYLSRMSLQTLSRGSVVLLLLSPNKNKNGHRSQTPNLILNKRSDQVRQAGDLCCPGGGVSWTLDRFLANILRLPGSPLLRWPGWQREPLRQRRLLSLLMAVGLREGWEEMRLNPMRFTFLGMLPEQHLVMFDRVIYPMVCWIPPQTFKPNWEVARIVPVSLDHLLDPNRYGRFRPFIDIAAGDAHQRLNANDFPCYIHNDNMSEETLWGATYRIVTDFLEIVFDYLPPATEEKPLYQRRLGNAYINGSR